MKNVKKKIYYHNTDAGGVVYYGEYLKFFEEGRTELLADKGIHTEKLLNQKIAFVVAKAEIEYKKPVRYSDTIEILTEIESSGCSSIVFSQKIIKDDFICCRARITVVCVNDKGYV